MPASAETSSTRELDSTFIEIRREKHHLRHWKWSGIFPYGGWIEDPHFVPTHVMNFCPEAAALIPQPARFQGFDVNPWFEDDTSETILAIESGGAVYEYRLSLRDLVGVRHGFTAVEKIYSFTNAESLLFLANLGLTTPALMEVALPLREGGSPAVYGKGSPEWTKIVATLEARCSAGSFTREACERLTVYDQHKD